MKKSFILLLFSSLILTVNACSDSCPSLDTADETAITTIITNDTASAINTNIYANFMALMHSDSEYYDGTFFDETYFQTNISNYRPYGFTNLSFCGSTVTCTSTNNTETHSSEFVMKKDGDTWKVWSWHKEDDILYQ